MPANAWSYTTTVVSSTSCPPMVAERWGATWGAAVDRDVTGTE
jgi:hypothetical protein